jgi:hypothetical protein
MASRIDMDAALEILEEYDATPAQHAAAAEFIKQEADAVLSGRKTKCFLIMAAADAAVKAGEGRVVFREPTQKHHGAWGCVFLRAATVALCARAG